MSRQVWQVAQEVKMKWSNISPYAAPYLEAMLEIENIGDRYYLDEGVDVVLRFLNNATHWRGEDARRIKKELLDMYEEYKKARTV